MIYQTWPVKNIGPYLEFHLKYAYVRRSPCNVDDPDVVIVTRRSCEYPGSGVGQAGEEEGEARSQSVLEVAGQETHQGGHTVIYGHWNTRGDQKGE